VTPVVNNEFHAFLLKKKAQMEMAATKKKIMVLDGVPAGNLLAPGTLGANGTQFDTNFTVSPLMILLLPVVLLLFSHKRKRRTNNN